MSALGTIHNHKMSLIKSVVGANDALLVDAHREFLAWKNKNPQVAKTNFGFALKHHEKCRRAITKKYDAFIKPKQYANAIATTCIINNKIYWNPHDNECWKNADRTPPPVPRNGSPVKVLYNHERDTVYRHVIELQ